MKELQFVPIGSVKMSRTRYWRNKAIAMNKAMKLISTTTFLIGMICGMIIGFCI